jgi:hypothetical protein
MWMRCQAQRRTPLELKDSQVSTLPLITTFHFLSFVGYVGAVPGTRDGALNMKKKNVHFTLQGTIRIGNYDRYFKIGDDVRDSTPVLVDSYDKDFKDLLEVCTRDEKEILLQNAMQMKAVMNRNR